MMKKVVVLLCGAAALGVACVPMLAQDAAQVSADELSAELQNLKQVAGYAPISGAGVRIELSDGRQGGQVSKKPAANGVSAIAGIVHDYDLLQVVNELRAVGVGGMALNDVRITGATAIRCVGPVIYVGGTPVTHPYRVEAVGDAAKIQKKFEIKHGVASLLRSTGINVKLSAVSNLSLSPAPVGK